MKKYRKKGCIFAGCALMAVLLGACGTDPQAPASPMISSGNVSVMEPAEPESVDSVNYQMVKEDQSIRDDDGNLLVEFTYERIALSGSQPAVQAINQQIKNDCAKFLSSERRTDFETNAKNAVQGGSLNPQMENGHWFNTAEATVTQNADGIFSIRMTTGWYMGGVFNQDYYGMNYNLHTGKSATLPELLGENEDTLTEKLREIVSTHLKADPGRFPSSENLSRYTSTDDFDFYVQDGKITLVFPTYEFGPGAAGATVIQTDLSIQPSS